MDVFQEHTVALLVATFPGHVVYDLAASVYFARIGHLRTFLSAKRAALAGLPQVWSSRRCVQRLRRASVGHLWSLMERQWLGLKMREKRFDRSLADP